MKKILVVQAEQLLGAAIISLLSNECDLNLMGCMADTNAELIERIIHLHPDVLIMAQADQFVAVIHQLLAAHHFKARLMTVSTEHNWVDIDNKRQILITARGDLAAIIRHGQTPAPVENLAQNHDHQVN